MEEKDNSQDTGRKEVEDGRGEGGSVDLRRVWDNGGIVRWDA